MLLVEIEAQQKNISSRNIKKEKKTVDSLILDLGLAFYLSGEKQAIKVAKKALPGLSSSQRKPIKQMLASKRVGPVVVTAVRMHLENAAKYAKEET